MSSKKKEDKDWNIWLIVLLIAVIAVLLNQNKGINFPSLNSGTTSENNNQGTYSLILDMNPSYFCQGSPVTGTITSNMPSATCNSQINTGAFWMNLQSFNLNSQGTYTNTQTINIAGSTQIRATCCINGDCVNSNTENAVSQSCNPTTTQSNTQTTYTCFDSDNGVDFDTLGSCEDSYHQIKYFESCYNGQVKEYYCDTMYICQVTYGGTCSDAWQNPEL